MKFFKSKTIRSRLVKILIFAIADVALIGAAVWHFSIEPALRMEVARNHQEVARRAADQIQEFIEGRVEELLTVAQIGRFWEMEKQTQREALYRLMKLDTQVHEVSIADREGQEILRISRSRVYADADLVSLGREEKFRQAIQGKSYIGQVYHVRTVGPFVTLAVPIKFTATDVKGVMVAEISLKNLWDSISYIKVGKSGHAFVVDLQGNLIAHPDYSKVLLGSNMAHLQRVKEFLAGPDQRPDFGKAVIGQEGERVVSTFAVVKGLAWGVFTVEPAATALAEIKRMERLALLVFAFMLAGVFGASYWFSERIAQPVRELEEGAKLVAQGNLEHKFKIHTGDEIETLANQFNQMAETLQMRQAETKQAQEVLQVRYKELATLYEMGQTILGSPDLKTTLEKILDKAVAVGSFDLGTILMVNPSQGRPEVLASFGYQDPANAERRLPEEGGERPPFRTIGLKEPRIVENVPASDGMRTLKKEGIQSAVTIPVSSGGQVIGTIQLGSRTPRKFQPNEIRLLETLGNHMGIAVQKARLYEETRRSLERMLALQEIGFATSSTLDLQVVLNLLMAKMDILLPYSVVLVWLVNKESGLIERTACWNLDEEEWKGRKLAGTPQLVKEAIERKTPVVVTNIQTDSRTLDPEFYRRHGLVSYLGVPLVVKGEVLGVLVFLTREEHNFADDEVEYLLTLAGQVAVAIHNSQLYEQTKNQALELEKANMDLKRREEVQKLLKELSQDITLLDIDSLLKKLTEKVCEFLQVDVSDVRLLERERWQLRAISGVDSDRLPAAWSGSTGTRQRSIWIRENRRALMIPDITEGPIESLGGVLEAIGIRGFLGVPILSRRCEVIGILRGLTYNARHFNQEEVEVLQQLANGAAIALENARLLDETKRQAVELEEANKAKDEFLGFMSHELRTPLNVITGYVEMFRDGMLGEINAEQEKALGKVASHSKDLLTMISGILQATSLEAGAVKVKADDVSLGDFLDELRSTYGVPFGKDLALKWNYPAELPVVRTDGEKLKHILENLINNAIKFTDKGRVAISARRVAGKEAVEFKVADTGIGIPEEYLPAIFERFRQVDGSDTRTHGGGGLGLHVVKKFTEMLGGEIDVKSEPGKGSTFTVTIPCESSQASAIISQEAGVSQQRKTVAES
ncbi:MAG: GAF domain-containing protein [Candidatus Binatia bacterium]